MNSTPSVTDSNKDYNNEFPQVKNSQSTTTGKRRNKQSKQHDEKTIQVGQAIIKSVEEQVPIIQIIQDTINAQLRADPAKVQTEEKMINDASQTEEFLNTQAEEQSKTADFFTEEQLEIKATNPFVTHPSILFPIPSDSSIIRSSTYTKIQLDTNGTRQELTVKLDQCLEKVSAINSVISSNNKTLPRYIDIDKSQVTNQMSNDEEKFKELRELIENVNLEANKRIALLIQTIKSDTKEILDLKGMQEQIAKRQTEIKGKFEELKSWVPIKDSDLENYIQDQDITETKPQANEGTKKIFVNINNLMKAMDALKDLVFHNNSTFLKLNKESFLCKKIVDKKDESIQTSEMNVQTIKHYLLIEWALFKNLSDKIPGLQREKDDKLQALRENLDKAKKDKAILSSKKEKIEKVEEEISSYQQCIQAIEIKWKSIMHRQKEVHEALISRNQMLPKEHQLVLNKDENEKFSSSKIEELKSQYMDPNLTSPTVQTGLELFIKTTELKEEVKSDLAAMQNQSNKKMGQTYYYENRAKFQNLIEKFKQFDSEKTQTSELLEKNIKVFQLDIETINSKIEDISKEYKTAEEKLIERQSWKLEEESQPETSFASSFMSYLWTSKQ